MVNVSCFCRGISFIRRMLKGRKLRVVSKGSQNTDSSVVVRYNERSAMKCRRRYAVPAMRKMMVFFSICCLVLEKRRRRNNPTRKRLRARGHPRLSQVMEKGVVWRV